MIRFAAIVLALLQAAAVLAAEPGSCPQTLRFVTLTGDRQTAEDRQFVAIAQGAGCPLVPQRVDMLVGERGDVLIVDEDWLERLEESQRAQIEPLHFAYSKKTVRPETVHVIDAGIQRFFDEASSRPSGS